MSRRHLRRYGATLLKEVSRSFYITMRVLPRRLRAPISLAYLLARATDTLADSTATPPDARRRLLEAFRGEILRSGTGDGSFLTDPALAEVVQAQRAVHPGEARLLEELRGLLDWLDAMDPADAAEVRWVLDIISRGQLLDLARFEQSPPQVRALATAQELEDYTYRVAGCVGEFWTRLCLRHLPNYSITERTLLLEKGRKFGQGLQLVNILRDFPTDIDNGRCYLPADELAAAGVVDLEQLRERSRLADEVFLTWRNRAWKFLEEGQQYALSLNSWRLRFACIVPVMLGLRTLRWVVVETTRNQDSPHFPRKVKLPRANTKKLVKELLWASRSREALVRWLRTT